MGDGKRKSVCIPPGTILDYAGSTVPGGWLACDGSAVSRATYKRLFLAIGTTWGTGDGSTTFNLPDMRRRVGVGSGGSGTATLANTVGSTGGAETHTLATSEIPSHSHTGAARASANTTGGGTETVPNTTGAGTWTSNTTGGGGSHNNLQPSAVVTKMIYAGL